MAPWRARCSAVARTIAKNYAAIGARATLGAKKLFKPANAVATLDFADMYIRYAYRRFAEYSGKVQLSNAISAPSVAFIISTKL